MFTYQAPAPGQTEKYQQIRSKAKELGHVLNNQCPESAEKENALQHLQQAVMLANASIALSGPIQAEPIPSASPRTDPLEPASTAELQQFAGKM